MDYKPTPKRLATALTATSIAAIILAATTTGFSARAETRGFAQSGFTALRVSSGLEMEVEVGPAFLVAAEGESEAIDTLDIRMEGATLVVERKHNWRETLFSWSSDQQRVLLRVSMPAVSTLTADAGARIEISGDIRQPLQAIALAGAALWLKGLDGADAVVTARAGASVMADGTCGTLKAEASSGASIQAAALVCSGVMADAMSGASIEVNGEDALSLVASGGGHVFAHGAGGITREDMNSGGSITVKR